MFPSTFGPLTITYWGSCPFPNSPLVVVYGSFIVNNNTSQRYFFWWPWTVPGSGLPIPGTPFLVQLDTHDMTVDPNNHVYAVGRDPSSGQGKLWAF